MGTANDVASTLALPKNAAKAAEIVMGGCTLDFDIGMFGDERYFTYIAAFGAFTDVSYQTSQEAKRSLGQLAYVLAGMNSLPRLKYHYVEVEHEHGGVSGDFIFGGVTNSTSVAGMLKLDPDFVNLGDGEFEVILIKNPHDLAEAANMAGDILSRNVHAQSVVALHSRWVKFHFEEDVAWTIDGEAGGSHREVTLVNPHRPLKILVSAERANLS